MESTSWTIEMEHGNPKRERSLAKSSGRNYFCVDDATLAETIARLKEEAARRTRAAIANNDDASIILGNLFAKRAILVAAAGGHSILLVGPTGCGKTMIRAMGFRIGAVESYEVRPCPCGYHSDPRHECLCSPDQIRKFVAKNFPETDMMAEVMPIPSSMRTPSQELTISELIRHVGYAKGTPIPSRIMRGSEVLLNAAVNELGISERDRAKSLEIAGTLARLEGEDRIHPSHIAEAVRYRPRKF